MRFVGARRDVDAGGAGVAQRVGGAGREAVVDGREGFAEEFARTGEIGFDAAAGEVEDAGDVAVGERAGDLGGELGGGGGAVGDGDADGDVLLGESLGELTGTVEAGDV